MAQRSSWLIAVGAFVAAAAVGFAIAFPAAVAAVCPPCFGFASAGGGIHVEREMTPGARDEAAAMIARARQRVRSFYGAEHGHPSILVCVTEDCYQRLRGGRSRGMAFYNFTLALSPRGVSETIAAHELSHIELHTRVGAWRVFRDAIPTWFDEGLAVVVSDDPRYLEPGGDRCLVRTDAPLPPTLREWQNAGDGDRLYAAAACRVNEWLVEHGGPAAVLRLAERLAAGEDFAVASR